MELSSALSLEMSGKPFLLEKRIELLHAIGEHGSISKAAKAVPMSYKSAWEAVDMMNSLSPESIVCRETGGKDGGGTTITAYGLTLLKKYALLKEEHTQFLARLSKLTDLHSSTFETMGRWSMQLSARNQIQAEIVSIHSENVNAKVHLRLKGGQELHAVITKEAVENLYLEAKQTIIAIVKSSTVLLSILEIKDKGVNSFEGNIIEIDTDDKNAKVSIDIRKQDKIVSVIGKVHLQSMQIQEGSPVWINIKNTDIMLGK
ncbi:MAG: molybdenum-binding protein [Epsilonproteobacteria bacterium]|nr:MAG: molybdenum-binding protein [Campylobacterota bacterium]